MTPKIPVGIPTLKANADIVRRVAKELGLKYEEQLVRGKDDAVRFYFGLLDPKVTEKLIEALPPEVYLQAISETQFRYRINSGKC
jgi:hypothetical protein